MLRPLMQGPGEPVGMHRGAANKSSMASHQQKTALGCSTAAVPEEGQKPLNGYRHSLLLCHNSVRHNRCPTHCKTVTVTGVIPGITTGTLLNILRAACKTLRCPS